MLITEIKDTLRFAREKIDYLTMYVDYLDSLGYKNDGEIVVKYIYQHIDDLQKDFMDLKTILKKYDKKGKRISRTSKKNTK